MADNTRYLLTLSEMRKEIRKLRGDTDKLIASIAGGGVFGRIFVTGSGRFGSGDNYSEFDGNGWIQSFGDGRSWVDINIGTASLGRGASAPDLIQIGPSGNIYAPGFDGGVLTEELFGAVELDHYWAEGTTIYPHIHWMPVDANAGNVVWQMNYNWIEEGDAMGADGLAVATAPTPGIAWSNTRADLTAIAGTGHTIGSQLAFRLFRDPGNVADTYASDAAALTIGFHVEKDSFGSRNVATK